MGQPTIFIPLSVILTISMIKDGLEDYKRYLSDKEENTKEVTKYEITKHGWTQAECQDLRIGDIILLKTN